MARVMPRLPNIRIGVGNAASERFRDRLAHHDELDEMIGAWTGQHTNMEIAERLQRAGVPPRRCWTMPGFAMDSHLRARDFWVLGDHRRFGKELFTNCAIKLSDTPGMVNRAAPVVGQDNDYVLNDLAGLVPAEIKAMEEKGAVLRWSLRK